MGTGTKYTTKSNLIASIVQKVFTNVSFKVTADNIQTALNNIVESLWSKKYEPVILEINDANLSMYYENKPYLSIYAYGLKAIPDNVDYIVINTTSLLRIAEISFVSNVPNGKNIRIFSTNTSGDGNLSLWEGNGNTNFINQLSRYYYSMTDSHNGSYNTKELYQEFMFWNGVWYYDGY